MGQRSDGCRAPTMDEPGQALYLSRIASRLNVPELRSRVSRVRGHPYASGGNLLHSVKRPLAKAQEPECTESPSAKRGRMPRPGRGQQPKRPTGPNSTRIANFNPEEYENLGCLSRRSARGGPLLFGHLCPTTSAQIGTHDTLQRGRCRPVRCFGGSGRFGVKDRGFPKPCLASASSAIIHCSWIGSHSCNMIVRQCYREPERHHVRRDDARLPLLAVVVRRHRCWTWW